MKKTITDNVVGGFYSKGMWVGFIIMGANWLNNNSHVVQEWVPKQYDELILYFIGIVIWGVRWITTEPLAKKTPSARAETKRVKALSPEAKWEEYLKSEETMDLF